MSSVLFTGISSIIGIWVIWCELDVQNDEVPLRYFQHSGCIIVTDCLKGDTAFILSFPFETLPKHSCHRVHYWKAQAPLPRLFPLSYQSLTLIPSLHTQRHLKHPDPTQSSRPRLEKLLSLSLTVCPSLALPFLLLLQYCSFYSHELCTCCRGF